MITQKHNQDYQKVFLYVKFLAYKLKRIQKMKKLILPALISSLIIGLSACGQTGPLYLPDQDANSGSTLATSGSTTGLMDSGSTSDNSNNNDTSSKDSQNKEMASSTADNKLPKPASTPDSQKPQQDGNSNDTDDQNTNSTAALKSGSSTKVDNDPTPPAKDYNTPTSELVDTQDNFNFDKNIQDSGDAGGTPDI